MEFVCNLQVPRTNDRTGVPTTWINDARIGYPARGFLGMLLSYAAPGVVVSDLDVVRSQHPDDPPVGAVVAELEQAGYLVPVDDDRYELVHPARMGGSEASSQW